MTVDKLVFDIVIVGGGTCGCALASRLKQKLPQLSVALIEYGPDEHKIIVEGDNEVSTH